MNLDRFTVTAQAVTHGEGLKKLARKVRTEVRKAERDLPGVVGPAKLALVVDRVVAWLDAQVVFTGRWAILEQWDQEILKVVIRALVESAVDELKKRDPDDDAAPARASAPVPSEPAPLA